MNIRNKEGLTRVLLFTSKSGAGFTPLESPSARNGNKKRAKERDVSSSLTGFTLVETMVVIAITAILTSMSIGYTRTNEKRIVLYAEQAKIVGMLGRAKALALQGYNRTAGNRLGVCYGVHFDFLPPTPETVSIYRADVAETGECGAYEESARIDTQTIDPRIEIVDVAVNDIAFKAPYVEVFQKGVSLTESLRVHLKIRSDMLSPVLRVEIGGGGSIGSK